MRTENLAIVFIDIAGFTPRTSSQTREENVRLLRRFDETVRPLVRAYNGRVVKTIGDAFLLTFRSPTDALLCSMAVHDRLAETDVIVESSERFIIRAAVNVGDVRIEGGDVFGEAVNIAARIEGKAAAGEIYFSESAYLSMTRTEVPSVEVGYSELKGIPGQVRLYRVPRAGEAGSHGPRQGDTADTNMSNLPYGGIGLSRVRNKLSVAIPANVKPSLTGAQGFFLTLLNHGMELALRFYEWWREEVRRSRAVQYVTILILIALVWFTVWALKPKPVPVSPLKKFLHSLHG